MTTQDTVTEASTLFSLDDIEYVKSVLNKGLCEVIFRKKDGTLRNMFATTNGSFLPEVVAKEENNEPKKERKVNPSNIPCFELRWSDELKGLEQVGWRSFNIETLIDIGLTVTYGR